MVNASDDDEYIQLNDIWTIQAYRYWQEYGLTSDSSYTYTDTYSTSGTFNQSATFSMTASSQGSESGSIAGSFALEYTESSVPYSVWIPKSVDLSLTPDSGQTGAMSYPNFACVYNPSATGASATMTCTPSGNSVFTQDNYTLEINTIGDAGDGTGGLFCYLRPSAQPQAVGTITATNESPFHANFTLSEITAGSGSFSGSGSITLTTTTVNTNKLDTAFPIMKGYISQNTNWTSGSPKIFYNRPNNPATVIMLVKQHWSATGTQSIDLYNQNNRLVGHTVVNNRNVNGAGFNIRAISFYSADLGDADEHWTSNNSFIVKWKITQYTELVPIYVGYFNNIPDDLYRYVYGGDRNIDAIHEQTAADQQHHDEQMDTTPINGLADDGDELIADADEKFGDLFFPLNHAIETANDLANVNATGVIRLPAIFSDNEYWYLDLTQIEQKLPDAWHFIQALCQLAVAIYLIHGLYNLFFGGSNDS